MEIYDETKFPPNIVKFIDNRALLNTAKEMLEILDCVNKALNTLQADYTDICGAVGVWMSLMSDERIPNTHMDGINKRFLESLTPYHVIAYMVGKKESDEDLPSKIYEETIWGDFVATINPYQMEDEDTFPVFVFNQEVKKVLQPVKYWQFAAKQCAEKQGTQTFCNVTFKQCGFGACVFKLLPCTH